MLREELRKGLQQRAIVSYATYYSESMPNKPRVGRFTVSGLHKPSRPAIGLGTESGCPGSTIDGSMQPTPISRSGGIGGGI